MIGSVPEGVDRYKARLRLYRDWKARMEAEYGVSFMRSALTPEEVVESSDWMAMLNGMEEVLDLTTEENVAILDDVGL